MSVASDQKIMNDDIIESLDKEIKPNSTISKIEDKIIS